MIVIANYFPLGKYYFALNFLAATINNLTLWLDYCSAFIWLHIFQVRHKEVVKVENHVKLYNPYAACENMNPNPVQYEKTALKIDCTLKIHTIAKNCINQYHSQLYETARTMPDAPKLTQTTYNARK